MHFQRCGTSQKSGTLTTRTQIEASPRSQNVDRLVLWHTKVVHEGAIDVNADVGKFCETMKCCLLPASIVDLLFAGRWHTLVLLARWYCHARVQQVRADFWVFPDWPDRSWVQALPDKLSSAWPPPDKGTPRITPEAFLQMADLLRTWAPSIMQDTEPNHLGEQRDVLIKGLEWLEGCAEHLSRGSVVTRVTKDKYSAYAVLNFVRASRQLRSVNHLTTVLKCGIEARWPGVFDTDTWDVQDPSLSQLRRWQFVVDLGLLLYQRKLNVHRKDVKCRTELGVITFAGLFSEV